jgi:Uma2 family endonuclease
MTLASLGATVSAMHGEAASSTFHLSDEEWAALPEDEPGELVDGMLVEEEMPGWAHETVVTWLIRVLGTWLMTKGGFLAGSEVKYVLWRGRGRKPDVSAFLSGRRPPPREGALRRPPDLAIEVISSDARDVRRDRIEKLAEYAAFGVLHYWIFDPAARTFEAYRLTADKRYVRLLDDDLGIDFAGLVLDLDALWAELDRLGPEEPRED